MDGFKFRRQHPVPPYIADFYYEACKLVAELDGSQMTIRLAGTARVFSRRKVSKVLRFRDNEVLQQVDAVLEVILRTAHDRTLTPTSLPEGEGLKSEQR